MRASTLERPSPPPAERSLARRRTSRRLRRFALLGVVVVVGMIFRDQIEGYVDRAVDVATDSVERLEGEQQLKAADIALQSLWRDHHTFNVGPELLAEYGPDVAWDDVVHVRPCLDGVAAVMVAETGRGDVSRLLVRGLSWGDQSGRLDCPETLLDPSPWEFRG